MLRGNAVEEGKKSIALSDGVLESTFAYVLTLLWAIMAGSSVALLKSRYHGLAGWQAKWVPEPGMVTTIACRTRMVRVAEQGEILDS